MIRRIALPSAVLFVAAIVAANWLNARYGFVAVGFGLSATAGTFAAGATLTLRDNVQDGYGRWPIAGLIVIGALLSAFVAPRTIAVASGAAFAIAETIDLAVYTPLRARNWTAAVWCSGMVGAAADSLVFLALAYGWQSVTSASVAGQVLGKTWPLLIVWGLTLTIRSRRVVAA